MQFVNYLFGRLNGTENKLPVSIASIITMAAFIGVYIKLYIDSRKKYKEIVVPLPDNFDKFQSYCATSVLLVRMIQIQLILKVAYLSYMIVCFALPSTLFQKLYLWYTFEEMCDQPDYDANNIYRLIVPSRWMPEL